jgi:cyclohexyl-isocyanide hydratase
MMNDSKAPKVRIGLLTFPGMLLLDLVGPWEVFSSAPGAEVFLLSKTTDPVVAAKGCSLQPTLLLEDCPQLDVVCVPGGPGIVSLLDDPTVLDFLRSQAEHARYVCSVCTGSLVLGAAGLLAGRRAACHWMSRSLLEAFDARPDEARIVCDGKFVTGGGVTAGIDFGLFLVAEIWGQAVAEGIQLAIEYDPHPPFQTGSPHSAPPELVDRLLQASATMQLDRARRVHEAARRLALETGRPAPGVQD